jgi:hypothetical protein
MKRISVEAPINRDFEPIACYRQLRYWLSYTGNSGIYTLVIPIILLLLFIGIRSDGITVALFSAGFSSFSLEIILILVFQVLYGYVYLMTGIFITLFMSGLAIGVFVAKYFPISATYGNLIKLQLNSVFLLLLSLAGIYFFSNFQLSSILLHFLFCFLIFCIATVTGIQFHIASVLKAGDINKVAATNYSADLVGSAAGAILVNAWIIPSFGFIASLFVVAGACICGIILMLIKKQV